LTVAIALRLKLAAFAAKSRRNLPRPNSVLTPKATALVGFEHESDDAVDGEPGAPVAACPIQWRSMMNEQNPLWLIVGAMAIFFVVAAAVLAAG
jgi:hypothetical protein